MALFSKCCAQSAPINVELLLIDTDNRLDIDPPANGSDLLLAFDFYSFRVPVLDEQA